MIIISDNDENYEVASNGWSCYVGSSCTPDELFSLIQSAEQNIRKEKCGHLPEVAILVGEELCEAKLRESEVQMETMYQVIDENGVVCFETDDYTKAQKVADELNGEVIWD